MTPQKNDLAVNWSSFKFTSLDKLDVNHVCDSYFMRDNSSVVYSEALKPAQKINLMAARPVPAVRPTPKLIAAREDGPVVRYDLRGLAKAPPIFADPSDPSGASVAPSLLSRSGRAPRSGRSPSTCNRRPSRRK